MRLSVLVLVALSEVVGVGCSHVRYAESTGRMKITLKDPRKLEVLVIPKGKKPVMVLEAGQDTARLGRGFAELVQFAALLGLSEEEAIRHYAQLEYPLSVHFERLGDSAIRWKCQNTPAPTIEPDGVNACPWDQPYILAKAGSLHGFLFDGTSLQFEADAAEMEATVSSGRGYVQKRERLVLREWNRRCGKVRLYDPPPIVYETKTKIEFFDLALRTSVSNVQRLEYSVSGKRKPLGSGWWITGVVLTGLGGVYTYAAVKGGSDPILYSALPLLGVGVLLDIVAIVDSKVPVERTRTGIWENTDETD